MRKARAGCADPGDGAQIDLYRDSSAAPLVDLRRRLRAVLDVLVAVRRSGFSVSRCLELTRQWDAIVAAGLWVLLLLMLLRGLWLGFGGYGGFCCNFAP